jgi:pimeloyl-ACP methyl ester carboxylesterase
MRARDDESRGPMSEETKKSMPGSAKKGGFARRALPAVVLIAIGLLISLPRPYHERTYLIEAGGCRLETTVFEPANGASINASPSPTPGTESSEAQSVGTVILFHGLAANRRIMSYLAQGFALQGLRVFVPDLPGHGKTSGPFSAARAEECGENLLHELRSRGLADPKSTFLAGHSMGGDIAIRLAARVPVAGVIAISPAPMRAAHGATAEALLFDNPPALAPNTEIINGTLEPAALTGNARDLLRPGIDLNSHYDLVTGATHGGLIVSPEALRLALGWTANVLQLPKHEQNRAALKDGPYIGLPSRVQLFGGLIGLTGLLLIAVPFLREASGMVAATKVANVSMPNESRVPLWRAASEIVVVGFVMVVVLLHWTPLRLVRLFEGDYLAGFLLLSGLLLIGLHWKAFKALFDFRTASAIGAMFGGAVLLLLFSAWLELSLTEAWLNAARWQRFALLFIALVPCMIAEEILLGSLPAQNLAVKQWKRVLVAQFYRLLIWLPLLTGVLYLHSGQILLILLSPYIAAFSIPQRRGMDVVREVTGSAAAAALFGAILLAGLFLVIFPLN